MVLRLLPVAGWAGRAVLLVLVTTSCRFEPPALGTGDAYDAGENLEKEAGISGRADAAPADSGDAGLTTDARPGDGAEPADAGLLDGAVPDTAVPDAGFEDTGSFDTGAPDTGAPDTGASDTGQVDAGDVEIPHLSPGERAAGTAAVVLTDQTIDTTNLSLGMPLPQGATFTSIPQGQGEPELAVLRVGSFATATGEVRVIGERALVIVSAGDVVIGGTLNAGAAESTPGAGGYGPGAGPGSGGNGGSRGSYSDSGGGGGGYGTDGLRGGHAEGGSAGGGGGGGTYGGPRIPVLEGGSGGGRGGNGGCQDNEGGAGGGAVQIYSATMIRIDGILSAGGGGGGRGPGCSGSNAGAGAGGGAGGALLLQAPVVENMGMIAANGGGGGGGGSSGFSGRPGWNARFGATAAPGGGTTGAYGERGGDGAYATTAAEPGNDALGSGINGGNAGGGGGGVGRIYILTTSPFANQGTISPPPELGTYP